ncbi:MAG: response regulator [Bacteroidetes bacterium]|nr:response regulator [Bacteroidota bacterium]
MSRILVIDDDVDILSVMEILLTMKGFSVETIANANNAVSKIENYLPDLILLDVLISGFDGRTICKEIKSNHKTSHIPIIMFSAHPGAEATIKDYGADDFIYKPFDVDYLLSRVNIQLGILN